MNDMQSSLERAIHQEEQRLIEAAKALHAGFVRQRDAFQGRTGRGRAKFFCPITLVLGQVEQGRLVLTWSQFISRKTQYQTGIDPKLRTGFARVQDGPQKDRIPDKKLLAYISHLDPSNAEQAAKRRALKKRGGNRTPPLTAEEYEDFSFLLIVTEVEAHLIRQAWAALKGYKAAMRTSTPFFYRVQPILDVRAPRRPL